MDEGKSWMVVLGGGDELWAIQTGSRLAKPLIAGTWKRISQWRQIRTAPRRSELIAWSGDRGTNLNRAPNLLAPSGVGSAPCWRHAAHSRIDPLVQ